MKPRLAFSVTLRLNEATENFPERVWMKFRDSLLVIDSFDDVQGSLDYNATNICNRSVRWDEV